VKASYSCIIKQLEANQTELDNPFNAPDFRQPSLIHNPLAECQSSTIYRKMKNKRIASEWLFFLGAFAFGIIAIPLLLLPFLSSVINGANYNVEKFYEAFFSDGEFVAWAIVFGPYLLIQLIRSIIWSIKTLKGESDV